MVEDDKRKVPPKKIDSIQDYKLSKKKKKRIFGETGIDTSGGTKPGEWTEDENILSRWTRFWCWFNDHRPFHKNAVRESPRSVLEGLAAATFTDVVCDRCNRNITYSVKDFCWKVRKR